MLHVSSSGNLIVKTEIVPRIGDNVVDDKLKSVGSVFDIIGSVKSPYASIRPTITDPQRLVKHPIYTIPSTGGRKERRRFGR